MHDIEKAESNPYDWVIIMGGTNDLGWYVLFRIFLFTKDFEVLQHYPGI